MNTCCSAISYGDLDERSAAGNFQLHRWRPARLSISFDLSEYQVNATKKNPARGATGFFKTDRRQLSAPLDREFNSPGGD